MSHQDVPIERYNYRLTFLREFTRVIILPPTLVHLSFSVFKRLQLPLIARVLVSILCIPVVYAARCRWARLMDEREAARRGACLVPVAKGSWPGNLGLLNKLTYWSDTRYIGYPWLKMAADVGSTTVNMRILGSDMVVTIDPGVVKFMLTTGFEKFEKGIIQKERVETFLGNGIFNRDGQIWKMHRAMTRPFFARERVSDFAIFERNTTTTLNLLASVAESSVPVLDVQDLFARFSLDASAEFLFGQRLDTLEAPRPIPGQATSGPKGSNAPIADNKSHFAEFAAAFERVQVIVAQRFKRGMFWKLFEAIQDTTAEPNRIIKEYLTPIVRQAVEEKKQSENDGIGGEETLLKHLLQSTDDIEMIRDELLNILLAGRDTTSALFSFVLYCLALNPEVEIKLREEINRCCGGSDATYENIKEMKYMRAVLNETLRLFPPVPGNLRETTSEGCVIPTESSNKPYYIPPRTILVFSPLVIHRRPDLWGKDAEEFNPERWLDAEKVAKYFTDFAFMPFNLGPRICLGQQFVYNEVSYLLSSIIPRFTLFLSPEYQPKGSLPPQCWRDPIALHEVGVRSTREPIEKIWIRNAITMYVVGGLWMKVQKVL